MTPSLKIMSNRKLPRVIKTQRGNIVLDDAGMYHFHHLYVGHVSEAAQFILEHLPKGAPCWFWFNGCTCPIEQNDTAGSLVSRWELWRDKSNELLTVLGQYARSPRH